MKTFTHNNTDGLDIIHIRGNNDDYTLTEDNGALIYESGTQDRKYIISLDSNDEIRFKHLDNNSKNKFKWDDTFTPFSIRTSCKNWKDRGATTDGLYMITPTGKSKMEVYCDMTREGGGWTMITSQANGHWFTDSGCDLDIVQTPNPLANRYSRMQDIDSITSDKEYLYSENRSDGTTRYVVTTQTESPFTARPSQGASSSLYNTPGGVMIGFSLISYSHLPIQDSANYLDGFGLTVNTSTTCKFSSNLYNWIWCITAKAQYTGDAPMVGGVWNDGESYTKTRHVTFWTR